MITLKVNLSELARAIVGASRDVEAIGPEVIDAEARELIAAWQETDSSTHEVTADVYGMHVSGGDVELEFVLNNEEALCMRRIALEYEYVSELEAAELSLTEILKKGLAQELEAAK